MARRPFSATFGVERLSVITVIGVLVAPLLIGSLLAWGLSAPGQHLELVTAAIVNDDDPVTVNGQTVPLGRELAAGLIGGQAGSGAPGDPTAAPSPSGSAAVGGSPSPPASASPHTTATSSAGTESAAASATSGTTPSPGPTTPNFTWLLTNDADAVAGLDNGRYAAVVTIPSSFSADATSISGPGDKAVQASISIQTTAATAFLDPPLTDVLVQAAVATLNASLTQRYLANIYAGFNQINASIAQAADDAAALAEGTSSLASGVQELATDTAQLASGAEQLDSGASQLDSGANELASGANDLATGLDSLDAGAESLARGLTRLDDSVTGLPKETAELAAGAAAVATALDAGAASLGRITDEFAAVVTRICAAPQRPDGDLCDRATDALGSLEAALSSVDKLTTGADEVAAGNKELAEAMPELVRGVGSASSGADDVADGAASAATGGAGVASGADDVATGADDVAQGAAGVAQGANGVAGGADDVASGASQVDDGAGQLADGLGDATSQIPTYSEDDVTVLSAVVAQPVATTFVLPATGSQSVPLFTVVALWIGGVIASLGHRAVPGSRMLTARSSIAVTAETTGRSAAIGAGQGLLVSLALIGFLEGSGSASFVAAGLMIGVVFAVVNQGLAGAFGGIGRMIAVLVAVVALVVGTASSVPPPFESAAAVLPTGPARDLLLATLGVGSPWAPAIALLVWGVVGVGLAFAGVVTRRTGDAALAAA